MVNHAAVVVMWGWPRQGMSPRGNLNSDMSYTTTFTNYNRGWKQPPQMTSWLADAAGKRCHPSSFKGRSWQAHTTFIQEMNTLLWKFPRQCRQTSCAYFLLGSDELKAIHIRHMFFRSGGGRVGGRTRGGPEEEVQAKKFPRHRPAVGALFYHPNIDIKKQRHINVPQPPAA